MRLLLATTLTVAACASAGPALAADERALDTWGDRASRICAAVDREIDRIPTPEDLKGFAVQLPKLLAEGRKEYRLIKALDRPAAQKAKIEAYLSSYPKLFAILGDMIVAAKANKAAAFQKLLAEGGPISSKAQALARQLKAPACAD